MTDEKVTYQCIAATQDTGDPVFYVAKGESHMEVILDTTDKCINVWYVTSEKKGDMKAMLDHLVEQLPINTLRFISPLDSEHKQVLSEAINQVNLPHVSFKEEPEHARDIHDALDGFEEVELDFDGKKCQALVGEWSVERS